MVADQEDVVAVKIINPADVVLRISMIFQQARKVFQLNEASGGYFCLADGETGQEVVCVRIGMIPHNPTASRNYIAVRELVARVAGSSAALPAIEPGVAKYGGVVAAFTGISPQVDEAITIAFAVSFCDMPVKKAVRATRGTRCFNEFKALFFRLEAVGELI